MNQEEHEKKENHLYSYNHTHNYAILDFEQLVHEYYPKSAPKARWLKNNNAVECTYDGPVTPFVNDASVRFALHVDEKVP